MKTEVLVQVTAPHFVAGVVVGVLAAPIVKYMATWSLTKIQTYCASKKWKCEKVYGPGDTSDMVGVSGCRA